MYPPHRKSGAERYRLDTTARTVTPLVSSRGLAAEAVGFDRPAHQAGAPSPA
jgi:hypothetical protein